ncbi:MAG: hypothetical protein WC374_07175 [Phycisphaerae bacterium]|jgi:hypothetical protein
MEIILSVIWFIFSILFFVLGFFSFKLSKLIIAPFAMPERADVIRDAKKYGFDPDEPIRNFITNFNTYLKNLDRTSHQQNIAAACGYLLASITAILSMILVWW